MRALVLQMRGKGDASRFVEQDEFLRYAGLPAAQMTFIDLFETPDFPPEELSHFDLFFVGGISRDIPTEPSWPEQRFPFIRNLHGLFRRAIDERVPALLSCGGFAIAGDMLGAQTLIREKDFELGVYRLQKTRAAEADVFLGPVPDGLAMVSGHVKYFSEAPPGTELLLYTNEYGPRIPVHAFKVIGAPFYAFQGHPEMSCPDLCERVKPMLYRKHYFPPRPGYPEDEALGYNPEDYDRFCSLQADTSEAQALLQRFVDLVQAGKV